MYSYTAVECDTTTSPSRTYGKFANAHVLHNSGFTPPNHAAASLNTTSEYSIPACSHIIRAGAPRPRMPQYPISSFFGIGSRVEVRASCVVVVVTARARV